MYRSEVKKAISLDPIFTEDIKFHINSLLYKPDFLSNVQVDIEGIDDLTSCARLFSAIKEYYEERDWEVDYIEAAPSGDGYKLSLVLY